MRAAVGVPVCSFWSMALVFGWLLAAAVAVLVPSARRRLVQKFKDIVESDPARIPPIRKLPAVPTEAAITAGVAGPRPQRRQRWQPQRQPTAPVGVSQPLVSCMVKRVGQTHSLCLLVLVCTPAVALRTPPLHCQKPSSLRPPRAPMHPSPNQPNPNQTSPQRRQRRSPHRRRSGASSRRRRWG